MNTINQLNEVKKYSFVRTVSRKLNDIVFNYKTMLGFSNTKTDKSIKFGYLTGIMYLVPSNYASLLGYKVKNTCNFESQECRQACLFKAGRGQFNSVKQARLNKTLFLLEHTNINTPRIDAIKSIIFDIKSLIVKAKNKRLMPCIRLNGTSDLPIHNYGIIDQFPNVQFYDYTKDYKKCIDYTSGMMTSNYHLTFSYSGELNNIEQCQELLKRGMNVAVVFKNGLPKTFLGYKVIDGDKHDLTFLYEKNVIVGLKPKGKVSDGLFLVDNTKL